MSEKKGSILITTLWITAILSLLAVGIGFRASLEVRLSAYSMDKLKARYLAEAGIVKARGRLSADTEDSIKKKYDTLYECGAIMKDDDTPENVFKGQFDSAGNETFSVYYTYKEQDEEEKTEKRRFGMLDEERKINIRLSKLNQMDDYREILARFSSKFTEEILDAIVNWQDTNADDPYYAALERPYECRKADLESVEELLLVKGVTSEIFEDIKDYVTVYGEGKININTAPERVLTAIIPDNKDLVEAIIRNREASEEMMRIGDFGGFKSIEDFTGFLRSRVSDTLIAKITGYFTVKADNFRIVAHGNARKIHKVITCVVERGDGESLGKVKYYNEE